MPALKDETRAAIRVLYFVDQLSLEDIAKVLGVSRRTVRSALVIRGGTRRRVVGPYHKENDS